MRNYLIGFGERLVQPVSITSGGGAKKHPYTFETARQRLAPQLAATLQSVSALPSRACPNDEAVVAVTLHPTYLAKSYFPENLLRAAGLRAVGSRAVHIVPHVRMKRAGRSRAGAADKEAEELPEAAPEIYVAGPRRSLANLAEAFSPNGAAASSADDVRKIERLRPLEGERIRSLPGDEAFLPLEVALHAASDGSDDYIIDGFRKWVTELGCEVNLNLRLPAGGLCFLPVRAPRSSVEHLSKFAFVRIIRRMPKLRMNDVLLRAAPTAQAFPVQLPTAAPLNAEVKVAIFDGGCPTYPALDPWVTRLKTPDTGPALPAAERHGLGVTSAVLFGPLRRGAAPEVPWARVDHWQVIDGAAIADEGAQMYTVLRRIDEVLSQRSYDFVNLSLGPDLPIEDDEVHAWTAVIDHHLAAGHTVLTNAVGNTGEADHDAGLARIQPCGDAVNGIGVGAANSLESPWSRASYSSIGPGRSPGFVKPDLLAFGGAFGAAEFQVMDMDQVGHATGQCGTSFAAPSVCRSGIGVRAHFGTKLTAPAVKALLVQHADPGQHPRHEVGWGRLPSELEDLVVCGDDEAHIVYQGNLSASQWMRFPIPEPLGGFGSAVSVMATFCYFTTVDAEDALNYTRAGLQIVFRPDTVSPPVQYLDKRTGKMRTPGQPASSPFFQGAGFYTKEAVRRADAHKWETVLRQERTFRAGSLKRPVFDVEHQARMNGRPATRRTDVPYALVLTIRAPEEADLYNRILTAYPNQLEVLRPTVEVPITVRSSR
jgi:hypothetical protein